MTFLTNGRFPILKTKSVIPRIDAREYYPPPEWAVWERLLFTLLDRAAIEFIERYTRPDRTLIWRDRWPGMDGSDDPYEGFMYLPLFYALGGSEQVYKESLDIWESITWQWTQYGQIYNEFDAYYDWMHHGEGYLYFYFFGLANPHILKHRQRAQRFADYYTGDDPTTPNYDRDRRLIRSPITGSRGPRFCQTEEDWETHREILDAYPPPFTDIPGVDPHGNTCPWTDDQTYKEIISRMNERQAKGDVPLNLNATTMVLHQYMYSQLPSYKQWVLDYVEAWSERTVHNGGITPDNVGLSGTVGEYNDGKWWGGYYGWRWPHGSMTILEPLINGCSNGALLTGNFDYLTAARSQLDLLWGLRKVVDGKTVVPTRHGDDGWYDYRLPHPMYAVYLWNISKEDEDAERVERTLIGDRFSSIDRRYGGYGTDTDGGHNGFNGNTVQWYRYIRGQDPDYPVKILKMNYDLACLQLQSLRSPKTDPLLIDHYQDPMSIHQWQQRTPMLMEALTQLTLGGPMHVYHGGLQHCAVRYYDALVKRPGLPPGTAALVERITSDAVTLSLVNLDTDAEHEVIIQAGGFGEHSFREVNVIGGPEEKKVALDSKWCLVHLGPSTGIKLRFTVNRYVNSPSYDTPWTHVEDGPNLLIGRQV